jgi:hypothetical protein
MAFIESFYSGALGGGVVFTSCKLGNGSERVDLSPGAYQRIELTSPEADYIPVGWCIEKINSWVLGSMTYLNGVLRYNKSWALVMGNSGTESITGLHLDIKVAWAKNVGGAETTYIDGSTWAYTSNCTYQSGGLYKLGRIVIVGLRLKVNVAGSTTNPPLIQINKVPYIPAQDASSSVFRFWAVGAWGTYGKEVAGYVQPNSDINQNGLRLSLCNPNIAVNDELNINVTYVCK